MPLFRQRAHSRDQRRADRRVVVVGAPFVTVRSRLLEEISECHGLCVELLVIDVLVRKGEDGVRGPEEQSTTGDQCDDAVKHRSILSWFSAQRSLNASPSTRR